MTKRRGGTYLKIIFVLAFIFMLSLVIVEVLRLMHLSSSVRNSVENAGLEMVISHYHETFGGMREGYEGAFKRERDKWVSKVLEEDISDTVRSFLRLSGSGGKLSKRSDKGKPVYEIKDIKFSVDEVGYRRESEEYKIKTTFTLVLYPFTNFIDLPFEQEFTISAKFMPKH